MLSALAGCPSGDAPLRAHHGDATDAVNFFLLALKPRPESAPVEQLARAADRDRWPGGARKLGVQCNRASASSAISFFQLEIYPAARSVVESVGPAVPAAGPAHDRSKAPAREPMIGQRFYATSN